MCSLKFTLIYQLLSTRVSPSIIVHVGSCENARSNDACCRWWCLGTDDLGLLSDADLDVRPTGVDEAIYRSLSAPKIKVVQRSL